MSTLITKILSEKSARASIALTAVTAATMAPWDSLA